jgi:Asp-tRNA(Asn)/Glu-tRNA(Gln) amidotransferase C subunit
MTINLNTEDMLKSIMDSFDRIEYIKAEDIPAIDLYMDQVTTFMDNKLRSTARYPDGDKILTKTMINNYAKNDLLPAPNKKKYSKEHVLLLIFIYYYKSFLSISDIQTLLRPITEKFFDNGKEFGLEDVYTEVFSMEKETVEHMKEDVKEKFLRAEKSFENAPGDDADFLRKFSFICELSFDVYVKKLLIEKMLDEMSKGETDSNS